MHTHTTCTSCGSTALYQVPNTPNGQSKIVFGDRLMRSVAIRQYVCTDCGRLEEWVNDKADLTELKVVLLVDRAKGLTDC